eukprot:TRINITY_DN5550_c0_g1_i1.p1 TRINITY_DN5550_c0_g1~~TRINITY_DN5550_c0_g1_i1.p1  ORF type:complete len:209 (+),score=62.48 TRINITY_DN5550_c0_g1_i1:337-963(+)
MALALALHNQIIEGCARRLKAYVVKTIGDSFMIACKTDEMAVALAIAIMEAIETCNRWPPGLPAPGLRVRIGAHRCTEVDCHFEEVAQGYDYFGPDVNDLSGGAAADAAPLLQWLALGARVLRLAVDPLGDADKAQTIQLLCAAWGLKAAVADASIEPLALRIVQVMRLLYPRLFESQQATDPSPGAARDGDHEDENEAPSDAEAQAE